MVDSSGTRKICLNLRHPRLVMARAIHLEDPLVRKDLLDRIRIRPEAHRTLLPPTRPIVLVSIFLNLHRTVQFVTRAILATRHCHIAVGSVTGCCHVTLFKTCT